MPSVYYLNDGTVSGVTLSGFGVVRPLSGTAGSSAFNGTTDTLSSGLAREYFNTGASGKTAWATPTLAAQTLTGTITVTMYGNESAMTTNARFSCQIFVYRGGSKLTYGPMFDLHDDVELGTSAASMTFSMSAIQTVLPLQSGDRIIVEVAAYPIQGGSYGGGNAFVEYDSSNTYVTFPVNLTESTATTHNGVASATGAGTLSASATTVGSRYGAATLTGAGGLTAVGAVVLGYPEGIGYIEGCGSSPTYSYRVDFRTQTVSSATAMFANMQKAAGLNGKSAGYIVNSYMTGVDAGRVTKVVFETSATSNLSVQMSSPRQGPGSLSAETKGYVCGGYNADLGGNLSRIDAFVFASETIGVIAATLALARSGQVGAYSSGRGYCFGYNYGTEIDGLRFDTEAAINPSAVLTIGRGDAAAVSSGYDAYLLGGSNGVTPYYYTTVDRFSFPHETCVAHSHSLAFGKSYGAGVSGMKHGVSCGGQQDTTPTNKIEGVDFITGAAVVYTAVLGVATTGNVPLWLRTMPFAERAIATSRGLLAPTVAVYPNDGIGYVVGGTSAVPTSRTVDKVVFATPSCVAAGITVYSALSAVAPGVGSSSHGYFLAATADKIGFVTGTGSTFSAGSPPDYGHAASKSKDHAYYLHGSGSPSTAKRKLAFATDTLSTPSGTMTASRLYPVAAFSATDAYSLGGYWSAAYLSGIEKLTFSSETAATTSATLATAREYGAGVSGGGYGYAAGGKIADTPTYSASIERLAFATDTVSSPGSSLSVERNTAAGMACRSSGLIIGGGNGTSSYIASIDSISYSSGAVSAFGAALPDGRASCRAASTVGGPFGLPAPAAGAGSMSASATVITGVQCTISGSGAVAAAGTLVVAFPTCSMLGSGSLAAASSVTLRGAAALSGTGALAVVSYARANLGYGYTRLVNSLSAMSFSTESVQTLGGTLAARSNSASAASKTNGYWLGGDYTPVFTLLPVESVARVRFSDDTYTETAVSFVKQSCGASIQSAQAGYVAGGLTWNIDMQQVIGSAIRKLPFSTEIVATIAATLTAAKQVPTGMNADSRGFILYESSDRYAATTDYLTFTTDTKGAASSLLAPAIDSMTVMHAPGFEYLFGGGYPYGLTDAASREVLRFDKFNETMAPVATWWPMDGAVGGALSGPDTGYINVGYSRKTFVFPTETLADSSGSWQLPNFSSLSSPQFPPTSTQSATAHGRGGAMVYAVSGSSLGKGFFGKADFGNRFVTLSFDAEVINKTRIEVWPVRSDEYPNNSGVGCVQNQVYGYLIGGESGGLNADDTIINSVVFQIEALRAVSATLSAQRSNSAEWSYGTAGYLSGGLSAGTPIASTTKLTFSNETVASVSSSLKATRYRGASFLSSTKGYYLGGNPTGSSPSYGVTEIESFVFATENHGDPSAALPQSRYEGCPTNSSTAGYLTGGWYDQYGTTTTYKLTFSSEAISTTSATPSFNVYRGATASSGTKGYMVGALLGQPTVITAMTFSSEAYADLAAAVELYEGYDANCGLPYLPGTAQVHFVSVTLSGNGSSSASATMGLGAQAACSGAGTCDAVGSVAAVVRGAASLAGAGSATCSASIGVVRAGVAVLAGQGAMTVAGSVYRSGASTCNAAGSMLVGATVLKTGLATIFGAGSMDASGQLVVGATATLSGVGQVSCAGTRGALGVAALAGSGVMSARGYAILPRGDAYGLPTAYCAIRPETIVVSTHDKALTGGQT